MPEKNQSLDIVLFYNMTDIAALAGYIIFKDNNKLSKVPRRTFLKNLSLELCRSEIEKRRANTFVNRIFTTKSAIEAIFGLPILDKSVVAPAKTAARSNNNRCKLCKDTGNPRKSTRTFCVHCDNPVCKIHKTTASICNSCDFIKNV